MPILNIPVTIRDFDAFKRHFNREWDQKVFSSKGRTSSIKHLTIDVEYLRHDHWLIICNSATPGHVGILAVEHKALFHCPEDLLLRDNPSATSDTAD